MSTRFLIAYALIALLASAGFAALWFSVLRGQWDRRRRRRGAERRSRDRQTAARTGSESINPLSEARPAPEPN